ncbi:hypothetical protein NP233_g12772 [Leucocoprinus birnbaumii]|uniref:Uncharacterized protein n=1 Tax=Leucocoprinus birnbaumii TaxID=56174 RepID=A0AAD5VHZ9_9AGAR|nr:hypothetical protein NP233_g12772 [Leucocoprinus birnbaumii]
MAKSPKKRKASKKTPITQKEKQPDKPESSEIKGPDINWTDDDHKYSWKLLTAIESDSGIKNGLYPPPGSNSSTQNGGGKTKIEWLWQVAIAVFRNDTEHGEQFETAYQANLPKNKTSRDAKKKATTLHQKWTDKIKSRLRIMKEKVQEHMGEMGETGAGLVAEEEIMEGTPLHNKWLAIKATDPWCFDMKCLIAERPNSKPIGIGHSGTSINLGVLSAAGSNDAQAALEQDLEANNVPIPDTTGDSTDNISTNEQATHDFLNMENHASSSDGDDSDENQSPTLPAPPISKSKTAARTGSSRPIPTPSVNPKPRKCTKMSEEFTAAICKEEITRQAEEVTRQKEIDLARVRLEVAGNVRIEMEKAKLLACSKKYELEMAKLRYKTFKREQQATLSHQPSFMHHQPSSSPTPHTSRLNNPFVHSSPTPDLSEGFQTNTQGSSLFPASSGNEAGDVPFGVYLPDRRLSK